MSIESSKILCSINKEKRIGEISYNKLNSKMTIVEYFRNDNIIVEFENGYQINTQYKAFKIGNVINPYDKSVYNIGYIGEGKYKTRENNKITNRYSIWRNMLERCYDETHRDRYKAYKDCVVCEEWHNYQNFSQWYEDNFYQIKNEVMCLDKDILVKGNKLYSPSTCIFVSQRINLLFTKCDKSRGDYPIGVNYHKKKKKYQANCSIYDTVSQKPKRKYLGSYIFPQQAYEIYKKFKEKYIKQVANEYRDKIPDKLYDALYRYEVDISD